MDKMRISEIIYDEESARPAIANFQNGYLQPAKENNLKCEILENKHNNYVVAVASDKLLYTGEIVRDEGVYNNFILTRNRKTGKCRLIAVDNVLLKAVKSEELKTSSKSLEESKSKSQLLTKLSKEFGSKQSKKRIEQNEKLRIDVKQMKDDLEQTAFRTELNESEIVHFHSDESGSMYRPPINRDAKDVKDVYSLENLIPLDILNTSRDYAMEALESKDISTSSFVKKEIEKLQNSSSAERVLKCQMLLFMNCLINTTTLPAKTVTNKKYVPCSFSSKMSTYIIDNFTANSDTKRTRPLSLRDKGICYILVIGMLACSYQLNLEELCKDLNLGFRKLVELSKILSFTMSKDQKIGSLKLPLPAPVSPRKQRKRK